VAAGPSAHSLICRGQRPVAPGPSATTAKPSDSPAEVTIATAWTSRPIAQCCGWARARSIWIRWFPATLESRSPWRQP